MKIRPNVSRNMVLEFLEYNQDTGNFICIKDGLGRLRAGDIAGYKTSHGYIKIDRGFIEEYAHRLAWLVMHNEMPEHEIDHINMVKDDNRWRNLRLATRSENGINKPAQSDSVTGIRGVYPDRGRFIAQIRINGKGVHLGSFNCIEDAIDARNGAILALHSEFGRMQDIGDYNGEN